MRDGVALRGALGGGFWRAVGVVAGGAAFAQAISLLAAPILTRLYTPAEYGTFALYLSTLLVLLVVCSLRYETAVPLPDDDASAAHLLVLALAIGLGASLLLGVAVLAGAGRALAGTPASALAPYLWLAPLALFAAAASQPMIFWATRHKAFNAIAKTRMTQGIGKISAQLALGALGAGPVGLIAGDVVGRAGGVGTLARSLRSSNWAAIRAVRPAGVLAVAARFRRFAAFSTTAAVLETGAIHAPALLLSFSFAIDVVGWFSLAHQVIFLPIGLVAVAVTQVYAGEAPRAARAGAAELRRVFLTTTRGLALIAIAPAIALAALAPFAFSLVFGSEWAEAGTFARLMAPVFFCSFAVAPLAYTLNVLGALRWLLAWNVARFAAVVGALVGVPALGGSAAEAVTAFSVALTVAYAALFGICLREIERRRRAEADVRI